MQLLSPDYCAALCERIRARFPDARIIDDPDVLVRVFPTLYLTLALAHDSVSAPARYNVIPPIYLTEPPPASPTFTLTLEGEEPGSLHLGLRPGTIRIIGHAVFETPSRPHLVLSE